MVGSAPQTIDDELNHTSETSVENDGSSSSSIIQNEADRHIKFLK